MFRVHFVFKKPAAQQTVANFLKFYDWDDQIYSEFMTRFLGSLEPRYYVVGEYIFEQGEEVDEHVFVISRDDRKPINSSGTYCIGFSYDIDTKYFHVKLGAKSIICGYENLFDKRAEYTYKALQRVDAFGIRKKDIKPIFDESKDLK